MKPSDPRTANELHGHFGQFIRERQGEILDDWERLVRSQPHARELTRPVLIDHLPQLLVCIAELAEQAAEGDSPEPSREAVEIHAVTRLQIGFDLAQVVNEFTLLRGCILDRWESERPGREPAGVVRALHGAIDQAVTASVERYTQAQNSALQALDRVSAAALESRTLEDFLRRLLIAVRATVATVDTAAVLLLEDETLRLRAAVGRAEEMDEVSLRIGEGFAGRVAAQRRPLLLAGEALSTHIDADFPRHEGLQAVYGLPLIEGDDLLGVVQVGSMSAADFAEQDVFLFATMASRATAAVVHHLLRDLAERRARQQTAIAELAAFGLSANEPRQVMERAVALLVCGLETDGASIEQLQPGSELTLRARSGDWTPPSPRPVEHGSQAAFTLAAAQPVIVVDYRTETRFDYPPPLRELGIRSAMTAVIRLPDEEDGGLYGLIGTYSRARRSFSRDDAVFLQTIGSVVASAIIRRRTADALILGARRFEAILDNVPAGVYLKDLQGRFMVVSRRFAELMGHDAAAIVGKSDDDLYPADVARALREDDRQVLEAGRALEIEEHAPVGGTPHTFLSVKFPLLDAAGQPYAICGISTDITERLSVETALRENEERLRLAVEVADLGTFDWDLPAGGIHWSNRIRRIFGMSKEVAIDQHNRAAGIHPQDRERALALIKAAMDPAGGGAYRAEYRVCPADGAPERWVDARGQVLFDQDGRPRRFIGVAVDITERKHADLERERLLRELEEAVRIRDDLLAIVSHDLRSPLSAIGMSAGLLARLAEAGDGRGQKQLDTILRASGRMTQLIDDLLDMANTRTGRLSMDRAACDATALANEAFELHAPVAAAKTVKLGKRLSVDGIAVCCDHGRVQQVFSNLLGNAIKFCGEGDSVWIQAEREQAMVRYTIVDSGPGIPPEALANIFEPYWSAQQHVSQGSGLGLFISKGIIEAHGGRLWVESTPGEGSAFHFTLPIVEKRE